MGPATPRGATGGCRARTQEPAGRLGRGPKSEAGCRAGRKPEAAALREATRTPRGAPGGHSNVAEPMARGTSGSDHLVPWPPGLGRTRCPPEANGPTPTLGSPEIDPGGNHVSTIEQPVAIDVDKLQQFVFRAVDEVGATLNTALVVMGDRLGLYRALAGAGGLSPAELARAHRVRRTLRPRMAQRPGRGWLRRIRPRQRAVHASARADGRAHRLRQPGLSPRLLPDRARFGDRLPEDRGRGSQRRRIRLARARARRARGLRALLPARLQRKPGDRLAAGARWRRRQSSSTGRTSPTSAADTAPPRF